MSSARAGPVEREEKLWRGGDPAIFDRGIAPDAWFAAYVRTVGAGRSQSRAVP
jgi:hypothetical protein